MKYLIKNQNVIITKIGELSTILVPDHDIVVDMDSFTMSVFENIDHCDTLVELVGQTLNHAEMFGVKQYDGFQNELRQELDKFLILLVQQGVLLLTKKINWQPCHFIEKENTWYVYAPYKRLFLSLSEESFCALRNSSVRTYSEIEDCPEADVKVMSLVDNLDTPIALNENMSYQYDFSKRVVLLPTSACNLKCSYCYAWRSQKTIRNMSIEVAEAGIKYAAINSIQAGVHSVDISFMGGGEPTCNWEVLMKSVDCARQIARDNDVMSTVTLTTNGVMSDDKLTWIIENVDNIKISFDGIESVQNLQRPMHNGSSFEKVSHTMRKLSDAKANFLVRITVTNNSLDYLRESVEYIVSNFSPSSIIINPVYVCGSCASHGVESIDFRKACAMFDQIQNLGMDKHIDIVMPYDKVTYMDVPKLPFCGFQKGNCFITPDGYVSACSEIDGVDDPRATVFFFGKYDNLSGEIVIDEEKEHQLHCISLANNEKCESCSNNMFCPGPCLVRRIDAKTMSHVLKMREGVDVTKAFSEQEYEFLIGASHSLESCIQCEMTTLLTEYQVARILECDEKLNNLSIMVSKIEDIKCDGVIKAVQIVTK